MSDNPVYSHTTQAYSGWKHSIVIERNSEGYYQITVTVAFTPMAYETTCTTFLSRDEVVELCQNLNSAIGKQI